MKYLITGNHAGIINISLLSRSSQGRSFNVAPATWYSRSWVTYWTLFQGKDP